MRERPRRRQDRLSAGFARFLERLAESEAAIRAAPAFGSDAERAAGYLHLARMTTRALQADVLQDPDYPYFRILDFWTREGGDNPDQRYAFTPVRGGASYRVWGRLGSAKRVELQLYAGEPWAGSGRSAGFLPFEAIEIADDGAFEILLTPDERDGSWLAMPDDATTMFVRQIYDRWVADDPGEVHIDRLGFEGRRQPLVTPEQLAEKFENAARTLHLGATRWPTFVQQRYAAPGTANRMSPLIDTYALGGVQGRWMAGGSFELSPGQVLVVKTWPTTAQYQAIQLTDLWFASLEYGNQVSSLTTEQSVLSPDGAYYTVIGPTDPGHANWLDTGGLARGVFLLRFDGVQGDIPGDRHPTAVLVDLADVESRIPGFVPVSAEEREATRAARRRHLQIRFDR